MRSACYPWLARWAAPLLFLSLTGGCTSEHDSVEKHLKKMEDDLTRLQSESDRMGERVDAMEARQASAPRGSDDRVSSGNGSSTSLSRPKLKIVRMEPGTELGGDSAEPEQGYGESDNSPRVVIQGEGKSLETRTMTAPTAAKSTPAPATKAPKTDKPPAEKPQKTDPAASK